MYQLLERSVLIIRSACTRDGPISDRFLMKNTAAGAMDAEG
jgi:hypothetical protein